jgi:hypothetical protein
MNFLSVILFFRRRFGQNGVSSNRSLEGQLVGGGPGRVELVVPVNREVEQGRRVSRSGSGADVMILIIFSPKNGVFYSKLVVFAKNHHNIVVKFAYA